MSVCAQTEENSASEEAGGGGAPVREMYETKAVSKVVRVLTVLAYLLSVSLAAILLSVYYVCVWKSPELPPLNGSEAEGLVSARRGHHHDYHVQDLHTSYSFAGAYGGSLEKADQYRGGSNISVSEESPTPGNVTSSAESDLFDPPPSSPDPPDPWDVSGADDTTDVIGTSTANEADVT